MHTIMVRWKIRPAFVAEFERVMKHHIAATRRTEPGCLQFEVSVDKADPTVFHLFEIYADDAALADHAKSPTLRGLVEKIPIWVEERALHNGTLWPTIGAADGQ